MAVSKNSANTKTCYSIYIGENIKIPLTTGQFIFMFVSTCFLSHHPWLNMAANNMFPIMHHPHHHFLSDANSCVNRRPAMISSIQMVAADAGFIVPIYV